MVLFSTFYWIWKKVWNFFYFFWKFWNFLNFHWIFTKNLIVSLRLFLVFITFFLFFLLFFYDLAIFFIQDGRTIMVLGVFSSFYCIWKKSEEKLLNFWFFLIFWLIISCNFRSEVFFQLFGRVLRPSGRRTRPKSWKKTSERKWQELQECTFVFFQLISNSLVKIHNKNRFFAHRSNGRNKKKAMKKDCCLFVSTFNHYLTLFETIVSSTFLYLLMKKSKRKISEFFLFSLF